MKALSQELIVDKKMLNFLCLRKCNQDHVENMHCQIRGYNGYNDHPSVDAYVNAIRCLACSISTSELLDSDISKGANCLVDGELDSLPYEAQSCTCDTQLKIPAPSTQSSPEVETAEWEQSIISALPPIETEVSNYIAGSVISKLMKKVKCQACVSLMKTTAASSYLKILKEYSPGSLVNASVPFVNLAVRFEAHFQLQTAEKLPLPHPRKQIVSSFFAKDPLDPSVYSCSEGHANMLENFIDAYCNIRIFHFVRCFNVTLKKDKQGNELNKKKKLNM